MKIILKKDIEKLGFKYDILNVKPGYARNYLIPNGYAIFASNSELKQLKEILKQRNKKEDKLIEEANIKVKKLNSLDIKIFSKVKENKKLFGKINNRELSKVLLNYGININKKFIDINNDYIKSTGKYQANIFLHRKVKTKIFFQVLPEKNN